jgi:Zn-dependent peptidase ImmA (M78 family)
VPRPALLEPAYGVRRIERRAAQCLERCRRKLGLKSVPLPVPVDEWIEAALGIRFGIADLSYLGDNVLGGTFVAEREILISDKVLAYEPRFRFTCAHELGHLMLHSKLRKCFRETDAHGPGSTHRIERQADRFAAAFLMPAPLVARQLVQTCDEHRLKHLDCIVELAMDTPESVWLWKKFFLPAITRRFGVSLAAAFFRFRDLRRFDGQPFAVAEHAERLLTRAQSDDGMPSMHVVNGFPRPEATLWS